jgi:hypothetical protein
MSLTALRTALIDQIELTSPDLWPALIAPMTGEFGGSLTPANPAHGWGPHWWELSLLDVMGTGETLEAAVHDWIKCTRRSCMAEEA